MNKSELVNCIRSGAGLKKEDSARALDAVLNAIADSLGKAEPVTLIGFGTFDVRERAAHKARNPQTGEIMDVPARKAVRFRAGKALKDALD